jgi:hypothetical protein
MSTTEISTTRVQHVNLYGAISRKLHEDDQKGIQGWNDIASAQDFPIDLLERLKSGSPVSLDEVRQIAKWLGQRESDFLSEEPMLPYGTEELAVAHKKARKAISKNSSLPSWAQHT